ncbi:MAG TPA: EF-P lysine aminoacylase EpmA [Xanthobacteraceae bacterium]|jgi:lysyl-tRNA synthetase class 2|nr:EF-P lysine aminoacylase EpmA [Xanthobacteraceae bacterium]
MPQRSPWWTPDIHADRQPFLRARQRVLTALRHYLEARDFAEVETAILQVSPGNEAHLHAFATELVTPGGARHQLFLHTSPEFACKKLLAAGERRIFEFARVFRNRERGALHHPEFTMLEWYRVGESCEALMDDCVGFLAVAAAAAGTDRFSFRGRDADPLAVPERVTVAQTFKDYAGIDLLATLGDRAPDRDGLAAQALAAGIRLADNDSWSDIFSRVLVERIEPRIGNGRATFLTEYPSQEAALARPKPSDPRVAERFELFICGVELANGFGELTDPVEQRTRLEAEMAKKQRLYGERYPIDEDFLAALAGMPPSSGCALGFDRLVMLAARASRVEQVIWTPLP